MASHADDVLAQAEAILTGAMMSHRSRIARDLQACGLDQRAFEAAVDAWHITYAANYQPLLASEAEEVHAEAVSAACLAAIEVYLGVLAE